MTQRIWSTRHNVSVFKICVGFSVDQRPTKQKRAIGRGNQFGFVKAVDDDWIDANIWDQGRESGLDYKCSIHTPPHYITHLLNNNQKCNQQQQNITNMQLNVLLFIVFRIFS